MDTCVISRPGFYRLQLVQGYPLQHTPKHNILLKPHSIAIESHTMELESSIIAYNLIRHIIL